ncbi:MAG: pilus (MSHA type) biogenesis protein MshL [Thiogranum sp.]|nr:pilus (MSHA type) biogenesis protein MshL [Thiogranum sp.]
MKIVNTVIATLLMSACQLMPEKQSPTMPSIKQALEAADTAAPAPAVEPPPEVQRALLPPASTTLGQFKPQVPTFNVSVNEVPARQFFMSLVEGTDENMVVHPEVDGTLTLDLKNVTTEGVMATVRDVYGYEYRHSHGVYQVFPARMRSQVFKVDYLDIQRQGGSRTRVSSGQVTDVASGDSGDSSNRSNTSGRRGNTQSSANGFSGAQVTTRTDADFWKDLETALKLIIGEEDGRNVVTNRLGGTIMVRATPRELLDVQQYLDALQDTVSRQVIIEAKILEVQLNDAFQTGVNWNALLDIGNNKEILFGQRGGATAVDTGFSEFAGDIVPLDVLSLSGSTATALGGVFALQADLGDFNALIELLKNQGDVQVLSSPRVSTVNNQKAIIKVGTDEYFVTDVNVDTDTTSGVSNRTVDVQLTPFFSGVALDVTPQIDKDGSITLHVHPAISDVRSDTKDIGISTGTDSDSDFNIPLAKSTIRESDTIIRARDGQVVVIGGLMQDMVRDNVASTPFLGDVPVVGHMFRHTRKVSTKTELVILLRPLIVENNHVWSREVSQATQRFNSIQHREWP